MRILATGLVAVVFYATAADDAPKVTSRPLDPRQNASLTILDEKAAIEKSLAVVGNKIADHVLLDRRGEPVRLADFRGKPMLVNFVYTGCFQVCPTIVKNMQKAVEATVATYGADRFNMISIGFNQPFDSPQAMKSFAVQQGVGLPNWEFLSPAQAIVGELTADFGFSYVQTAAGFDHMNQITIVDADGRIVRQVYGETFTKEMLVDPLKALIVGDALPPQKVTIEDMVDKVRIMCSIYDPLTGKYRVNYTVFYEIAGGLTFFIWLAWFLWAERRKAKKQNIPGT